MGAEIDHNLCTNTFLLSGACHGEKEQGDLPQTKVQLQATLVHVTKQNDQGSWLGCASDAMHQ